MGVLGNHDEHAWDLLSQGVASFNEPAAGSKYSGYAGCNQDTHYTGDDGVKIRQVQCICTGSKGCFWYWRYNLPRNCIQHDQCDAPLNEINWETAPEGKSAFMAPNALGKEGGIFTARIYYNNPNNGIANDMSNGWTFFIVTDGQIQCNEDDWSKCIYSPNADVVGVTQEDDCTSTVIQLQSEEFYGHGHEGLFLHNGETYSDRAERKRRFYDRDNFHQFQIVFSNVDWGLDTDSFTWKDVDAHFAPTTGWLAGRYQDSTSCIAEVFSERPPFGTKKVQSNGSTNICQ